MSTTQTASVDTVPPKSRRLFRLYDPEVVAVIAILLGLFQVLLAVPTYNISLNTTFLFMCPLSVGCVSVIAGSLSMASERTPSRQLLKKSMFAGLASLGLALIAVFLYGYAVINNPVLPHCPEPDPEVTHFYENNTCPRDVFLHLNNAISGLLIFYDVVALAVHCFLSYSAFQGLKTL
ncbi:uncharacterized protein si:dkey-9i23.16 [Triplophysa rosa]|uniref:Uncharacterized protein n=1 Tax=Triplophysa rosa TaxID=992332 RepID=A0A9W7WYR7_TRIRA|nr:uncharacterized protein si:dkey-9i23.16 [Triplophysa rosa]KAI7810863.1 hypothetical protein IRJ41_007483 [Triplophysa rosa]